MKYKRTRNRYNYEIRSAKRASWKKFTESLVAVPEISRLQRALRGDRQTRVGAFRLATGELTATMDDSLNHLMDVHFPGSRDCLQPSLEGLSRRTTYSRGYDGFIKALVTEEKVYTNAKSFRP